MLPPIRDGVTSRGPVLGARAEVQYAGLHNAWTATRLAAATFSMGMTLIFGRKQKGAATLVITYGNGAVETRRLRTKQLGAAQRYAAEFSGYAQTLGDEFFSRAMSSQRPGRYAPGGPMDINS